MSSAVLLECVHDIGVCILLKTEVQFLLGPIILNLRMYKGVTFLLFWSFSFGEFSQDARFDTAGIAGGVVDNEESLSFQI